MSHFSTPIELSHKIPTLQHHKLMKTTHNLIYHPFPHPPSTHQNYVLSYRNWYKAVESLRAPLTAFPPLIEFANLYQPEYLCFKLLYTSFHQHHLAHNFHYTLHNLVKRPQNWCCKPILMFRMRYLVCAVCIEASLVFCGVRDPRAGLSLRGSWIFAFEAWYLVVIWPFPDWMGHSLSLKNFGCFWDGMQPNMQHKKVGWCKCGYGQASQFPSCTAASTN